MRFENGQRVVVVNPEHPMVGEAGTVVRLLRRTIEEAWVEMDKNLPLDLRCFPADDPHGRRNHTLLLRADCALAEGLLFQKPLSEPIDFASSVPAEPIATHEK